MTAADYIWQRHDWPAFRWRAERLLPLLSDARHRQGRLLGTMASVGFDLRLESELAATADDVLKTSAIEGEVLDPASVRSSIARRLGLPDGGLRPADRRVDGVVEMLLDATRHFDRELTARRVFGWHAALFPTGHAGIQPIDVGRWRRDQHGPMQVISGAFGRQRVHYEAPPARRLRAEVDAFLTWFNHAGGDLDGILRAGLAHLWFVTLHPLDDGNGRIARAVADLAVAQAERIGQRFYSMSSEIERDKARYYAILESTQKGDLDVTDWLVWFTERYVAAIDAAETITRKVLDRVRFWQEHATRPPFSPRQQKVLTRLLGDFEGFMTAGKWANLCRCSRDTAQRDIADLVDRGLLRKNPGGSKRTSYAFVWAPPADPWPAAPRPAPRPASRPPRRKT